MSLALRDRTAQHTTSGSCLSLHEEAAVIIGLFPFAASSTAASYALVRPDTVTRPAPQWPLCEAPSSHPALVHRLRHLSGLTWEELGEVLNVSRRTVHNWANGEAIKPLHGQHLRETMQAIERLQRGSADATRSALLASGPDHQRAIDCLKAGRYDEAVARAIAADIAQQNIVPDRTDAHPVQYLDAIGEPAAPSTGHALRGRTKRLPRATP